MTALAQIVAVDQAAALARLRDQLGKPPPVIFIAPPETSPGGVPSHSAVDWPRPTRKAKRL